MADIGRGCPTTVEIWSRPVKSRPNSVEVEFVDGLMIQPVGWRPPQEPCPTAGSTSEMRGGSGALDCLQSQLHLPPQRLPPTQRSMTPRHDPEAPCGLFMWTLCTRSSAFPDLRPCANHTGHIGIRPDILDAPAFDPKHQCLPNIGRHRVELGRFPAEIGRSPPNAENTARNWRCSRWPPGCRMSRATHRRLRRPMPSPACPHRQRP